MQLKLFAQSAGKVRKDTGGTNGADRSATVRFAGARGVSKKRGAKPALQMEEIAHVRNLEEAFQNVAKNRGAPGADGKSIAEVRKSLRKLLPELSTSLLDGTYQPGLVRRVWIPKSNGGQRGLGIPNVVDRIVQQAVRQVLEPHYDPEFDRSSHGFRPKKSCHTAIEEAKGYLQDGYDFVVDIDLEKFFDTVNHQRLLSRLGQKIDDKRILQLIKRMLKAKTVMPDGVVIEGKEGTPQGGPLSPLLSNIVLDELDQELRERGHKFVRYADDCNIYVKSEKAGRRVLESIDRFISKRLRLKINQNKTAVARPSERHFLGFTLEHDIETDTVKVKLSDRSRTRIANKAKELTPRTWGKSLDACIRVLNTYLTGWIGHFKICTEDELYNFKRIDAHIRRRLRAIQLKQWKRKRTVVQRLTRRGADKNKARKLIYEGKRAVWKLSHTSTVERALSNKHFLARGLVTLEGLWTKYAARRNVQLALALG